MYPADFDPKQESMSAGAWDSKPQSEGGQLIICPSEISDCGQLGAQLESCDVPDHSLGGGDPLPSKSQGEVCPKPKADVTASGDDVSYFDSRQQVVFVPEKQVIKQKESIFMVYLTGGQSFFLRSLLIMKSWLGSAPSLFLRFFFKVYLADSEPIDFAPKLENMFTAACDSEPQSERGQLIIFPSKISDCGQLGLQLEICDVSDHNLGGCHLLPSESQGEAYSKLKVDVTAASDDVSDFDSGGEWHTTDTTNSTFSDDSSGSGSSESNAVLTTASVATADDSDLGSYRNWKDLIPDVLCMIVKSLPLVDNIHFGAVCTNWYSVAAQSHHPPAPQPPFLLLPRDSTGTNDYCRFFDLSYNRFYKICLPQLRNRRCLGSSQGKLIYIDERAELHVLDPITRSEFHLPSITTFDNFGDPHFDEDGNLAGYKYHAIFDTHNPPTDDPVDCFIDLFFSKVIICPKTSAVVAICQEEMIIAFCMPGDKSWTMIDTRTPTLMRDWRLQEFWDIVFYKDVLYTLTRHGTLGSLQFGDDFKAIKVEVVGPDFRREHLTYKFTYLVEAGGELLQVWRRTNYEELSGYFKVHVTLGFRVFKMNWSSMLWEEMKDIGEYALFLGLNDSFSLSTRGFPELKPNCIYFTDDDFDKDAVGPRPKRDAGVFNLEDDTIEPCYPSDDHFGLDWPHLIWFTPKGLPSRFLNVFQQ